MTTPPTTPPGDNAGVVALPATPETDMSVLDAQVEAHVTASVAPNTRRSYQQAWNTFTAWCEAHQQPATPIPETVARWLSDSATLTRPDGQPMFTVGTLKVRLSGVGQAAKALGYPNPAHDPVVQRVMAGITRQKRARPRRVNPLGVGVAADVVAVMNFTQWPHIVKATRDAAIILAGLAGALRRSEMVGLNLEHLTVSPDNTGAAHLLVAASKTDQAGEGITKYVPRGSRAHMCPACAIWRWTRMVVLADTAAPRASWLRVLNETNRDVHVCGDPQPTPPDPSLPWLRPVTRHGNVLAPPDLPPAGDMPVSLRQEALPLNSGSRYTRHPDQWLRLSTRAIADTIQTRIADAGFNPALFSGHSPRAGFITDSFAAGADVRSIQRQSGHRSTTALTVYDRDYTPGNNNAVNRLGF